MGDTIADALAEVLERSLARGETSVQVDAKTSQDFFARNEGQSPPASGARNGPSRPSTPSTAQRPVQKKRPHPSAGGKRKFGAPLGPPAPTQQQSQPQRAPTPPPASERTSPPAPPPPQQQPVPQGPPLSSLGWEDLWRRANACQLCPLCQGRNRVVFGEGSIEARLMFIGEAPGFHEDQQGKPFVGKAGELLTKMIGAMQFRREDVYIANICKCRPPDNRDPEQEEAYTCLPYLQRQIELVKPEVIVLLGRIALQYLLGINGITRHRGTWQEYQGVAVMPTFHPAALLHSDSRSKKADVWNDLQQVMQRLGKDPKETMRQHRGQ